MLRLLIFILVFIAILTPSNEVVASSYSPGATIIMTGSNMDVRFDVASDLSTFDATVPTLETATKTFTGAFYATGIGWIEFSTGAYHVGLDCGAQSLNSLTSNCTFTNTGWSENIGEIGFTGVQYNPSTGLLEWYATSHMGDINLTGIALPLRPVRIMGTSIIANHNATLTVSGAWMDSGGNAIWNMSIMPLGTLDIRHVAGTNGIFAVDLSLAAPYEVRVTDTNGSETVFFLTVSSWLPTLSLDTSSFYAKTFCNTAGSWTLLCPDTTASLTDDNRSASSLLQFPPMGTIIANGSDAYQYTMKARDTYGNKIETGSLKVRYNTTIKRVQVDPLSGTGNLNYGPSIDGDAFISSDLWSGLGGSIEKITPIVMSDFSYSIASEAPTNTTDNVIRLDSIKYLSGGVETLLITTTAILDFTAPYTASTTTGTPIIGVPNTFTTTVVKHDITSTIAPTIISTLLIGDGSNAEWRTLSSIPVAACVREPFATVTNTLCDWSGISSIIATQTGSDYPFFATYTGKIPSPPLESTDLNTYIYYKIGTNDILYKMWGTSIAPPIVTSNRLRVFGQTSDGMNIGVQNRVRMINTLREKTALLSRNRTDYTTANYVVYTGNQTLTDASFTDKRTIVVIGWDVTIDTNIARRAHPVAVIALTNSSNQGGNIRIKWAVTDIHSSLITEHGITSEVSNSQLYIHGSLISANPPQEVAPSTCPYFASASCVRSDYDLPGSRAGYVSPSSMSAGGASYINPLIIETDTRLNGDPPPAISK